MPIFIERRGGIDERHHQDFQHSFDVAHTSILLRLAYLAEEIRRDYGFQALCVTPISLNLWNGQIFT